MITCALLGNPNVGKTTIFNSLTGSNQYTGNWPGVTVEKKEGYIGKKVKVVDLPGIYAMDTYSNEEKVSKKFLDKGNVDVIVNITDASSLNRNLYLTMQLKQFKKPIVLVLNMMDVAKSKGIEIDTQKLSQKLGVKILQLSATKGDGVDILKELLIGGDFFSNISDNDYQMGNEDETYRYIEKILKACLIENKSIKKTETEKIDKLVLNKWIAYPFFILIMYLIFKFTFSWVGQPLAGKLNELLDNQFVPIIARLLSNSSSWFKSLIVDGIIAGVGSVIIFLPVILTLFLGISFLEDSGYMSRAAFIMDKLMRKMGLSGKAFIPLIVGFGCSVPGIMTARTLESEKDRKLTALLVPLMSCNARLPVYALFASVFFPGNETTIVFSLYFIGILVAFILGIIFKNTVFKKDEEPFIIELPEYKMPEIKSLLKHTWEKGKGFLKKAGTIIFSISVLVWFLSNFSINGLSQMNSSFLAEIGHFISPIFVPLGFGTWQNAVSLLTGLMAKEVVVGTMGVIYGDNLRNALSQNFTAISAYSFMVFVLLYTPCVSVVATMKKEFGGKMAAFSVTFQLLLAWIVSFIVFNIGKPILGMIS